MNSLLQYRSLFSIEVLHDFYLSEDTGLFNNNPALRQEILNRQRQNYQLARILNIGPTPDCAQTLRDRQMIFKLNNNGCYAGARVAPVNGAFTPYIPIDDPIRLRFTMTVNNPHFYNFTNLRLENNSQQRDRFIYYFSNRAGNVVPVAGEADRLYLTQALPAFSTDSSYEAGDIILDGGNILREAIEAITAGNPINLAQWHTIYAGQNPHFQFVTADDRVALRPSIFEHPVADESQAFEAVTILIRDRSGVILDTFRFLANDPSDPAATLASCTLNLERFGPDIYQLEVQEPDGTPIPDFNLRFYLDDSLYIEQPLALIECFHEPDGSLGAYRWLDESSGDQLLQPLYRIRWKNRPTFWRYYYREAESFDPASSDVALWNSGAPDPLILITNTQHGLTQIPQRVEIQLTDAVNNPTEIELLPNAGIAAIFPENGRVYSEINMGGGLGPP